MNIDNGGVSPVDVANSNNKFDKVMIESLELTVAGATKVVFLSNGLPLATYNFDAAGGICVVGSDKMKMTGHPGAKITMTCDPVVLVTGRATVIHTELGE